MQPDDQPRYRIQAVSDMTGVPSPTLRAWERRYGVPSPSRTDKGYRLYSARDVEIISRMRDLCDQGMAAADSARLVREQSERAAAGPEASPDDDPYAVMVDRLYEAVVAMDAEMLQHQLRGTMAMGSASQIYEQAFAPLLRRVGDAWHAGELSVAQEHLASTALSDASRTMLQLLQPVGAPRTAVLGCFADELHDLPLYGIAFRLAQWGFRCIVLGARTPPEAVADVVNRISPDLIGLSLTVPPPPARLEALGKAYAEAVGEVPWIVGGSGAQAARQVLEDAGARVHGTDLEQLRLELSALRTGD